MPISSTSGLGWIPDIPDRRDKRFERAVEHMKQGLGEPQRLRGRGRSGRGAANGRASADGTASSAGESARVAATPPGDASPAVVAPPKHTYQGWAATAQRHRELVQAEPKSSREDDLSQAFRRALKAAFPEEARDALLLDAPPEGELPPIVDLRPFMSPIEDQEELGSCTAHAVMGLVEYLQIALAGTYIDGSRLFLYKATRDLLQWTGDTGAYIRETIKAMSNFGVCPEQYYPYDIAGFDAQPSGFCYSFASNYKAVAYYRLADLDEIKRSLAQGYPVAFGFTCYESIDSHAVARTGIIPYPLGAERTVGGHAVLAVGYIDEPDWYGEGVLIIRNSWGERWGQRGYGFLPYTYIEGSGTDADPASDDYWTMTQMEFGDIDSAHAAPFALGRTPGRAGVQGPPLVRPDAMLRPGRVPRRGNPVMAPFMGGNPVMSPLMGGNPVMLGGGGLLAPVMGGNPCMRGLAHDLALREAGPDEEEGIELGSASKALLEQVGAAGPRHGRWTKNHASPLANGVAARPGAKAPQAKRHKKK